MRKHDNAYQRNYRQRRLRQGWVFFSVFIPKELAEELREIHRKWKLDNWDRYRPEEIQEMEESSQ